MRILIISYLYPPIWEAQSVRWYYVSKTLAKLGASVDLLTVKLPGAEDISDINVMRISPGPYEGMLFTYKTSKGIETPELSAKRRTSSIFSALKKVYRFLRKGGNYLLLGDVRNEWFVSFLAFYVRFLRQRIEDYDFVIVAHEPMVDLFIGLFLKKMHPRIRLVVDMADPLSADYYPGVWKPILSRLEKRILSVGELILLTNEAIAEHYRDKYRVSGHKFFILTQGFDEDLFRNLRYKGAPREGEVKLFYAGSFYPFRNPKNFFRALSKTRGFKFYYAGRSEEYIPRELLRSKKVVYLGALPHPRVLEIARKMDVLVYFSNEQRLQLAGKIFEYMGLKKPILCITNWDDEATKLIRRYGIGLIVRNDERDILKALESLRDKKTWARFDFPEELVHFSWQSQVKRLYDYLK